MGNVLERASRAAIDLLFPAQCTLCGTAGALVCAQCVDALPPADGRRCVRCWTSLARHEACGNCGERMPVFASLRAAYVMEEGARSLVHQLKYNGLSALAPPMAMLMVATVRTDGDPDLVVAVPLHRGRQRSRGYNQAAALGRDVARASGLAFDAGAMRRTRATAPLARTMRRDERRAIVEGAFTADRRRVDGRSILLIDDVVTTGATLDVCAEALLAAGAVRVTCMTFARAD